MSGSVEGDIIVQVDFRDVTGESSVDVARRVLGQEGTPITLTLNTEFSRHIYVHMFYHIHTHT